MQKRHIISYNIAVFRLRDFVFIDKITNMNNVDHKFLQIYFLENFDDEINHRYAISRSVKQEIIRQIQQLLYEHNQLVKFFKTALKMMPLNDHKIVIKVDKRPANEHKIKNFGSKEYGRRRFKYKNSKLNRWSIAFI